MKTWQHSLYFSVLLLTVSCRAIRADQASEIKWAHATAKNSISVMNARLQYLELGFQSDFQSIDVCVQNSDFYKGPSLLLETKLAYAAWLDASDQGNEDSWKLFQFTIDSRCSMTDTNFSSVIVIGDPKKITADQQVEKSFAANSLSCKKSGSSASCSTGKMLLGLGSPGTIGYKYFQTQIWESVSNLSPATVILSPFVRWISLEDELSSTSLTTSYKDLIGHAEAVTYLELKTFNDKLSAAKFKTNKQGRLNDEVQRFVLSKETNAKLSYTPIQPAFHVLLHEVGHQFGMDHADNPSIDSETGTVKKAQKDPATGEIVCCETDEATMAYAEEYAYLTADDKAGISDLARKNLELLKSHKRPPMD